MGKIKTLIQRGEPMPEGWMVGRDGKPLTDPTRHKEGLMLPIGGPKGFGLSVAVGLLAGVLNGAAFGADVVDFTTDTTSPTNTGQFVAAIDIAAFTEPATFAATTARVFEEFRSAAPLPGHEPIRLPGEGRESLRAARETEGIALHPSLLAALTELAAEFGLAPPAG
jgi:LDH2 family malate/lactate/ureidoglycolate dehydrogenase